jgi:hypothetical protein
MNSPQKTKNRISTWARLNQVGSAKFADEEKRRRWWRPANNGSHEMKLRDRAIKKGHRPAVGQQQQL